MDKIFESYARQLAEEARKQRLVAFIGAGCSKSAGLPLWSELIESMLKEEGIETVETPLKHGNQPDIQAFYTSRTTENHSEKG